MVKLTFLGTGNAFGAGGRLTSSYLLEGSKTILVDAGYAVFSSLKKNNKSIKDLDAILLSHLHPDHYMGIPQFALENYYVIKREQKIPVYCPLETRDLIFNVANLIYDETIANHIDELFDFHEFGDTHEIDIPGGNIKTLPASHSGNARMMIIEIDGKTLGYTGDTELVEDSLKKLLECDITISEVSSSGFSIPHHTSLEDLQSLNISKNKRLYLSHVGDSVIKNREKIIPPLYLSDDEMQIEF